MTDETLFRRAMHALAVNFNRELDSDVLQVYWRALNSVTMTDAEFAAAVTLAVRQEKQMPPIARLIELARPEHDVRAEALSAFGKIARCTTHNPASGEYVSRALVLQRLGAIAVTAFDAVGGSRTWASDPQHRLRDFVTVYEHERAVEQRQALALTQHSKTLTPAHPTMIEAH